MRNKTFGDVKVGDIIYEFTNGAVTEFTVDSIEKGITESTIVIKSHYKYGKKDDDVRKSRNIFSRDESHDYQFATDVPTLLEQLNEINEYSKSNLRKYEYAIYH